MKTLCAAFPLLAASFLGTVSLLAQENKPKVEEEKSVPKKVPLKVLSTTELDAILSKRLDGGMDYDFKQFANMFFVFSHIKLGTGVVLSPRTREIADKELMSLFPQFYRPTLREFCDSIALQTFSEWKYDVEDQFVSSTVPDTKKVDDSMVVLRFEPATRQKPFEVTLAKGWKAEDKGQWTMHIPPSFPCGMDIYEAGTYSARKKEDEPALLKKVPVEVSLEWARRFKPETSEKDLKPAKVGSFDALAFEAMVPSQFEKETRWRQWVFMDGNKCYFIVSTIFPEQEKEIFPDVEAMLKTFKITPAKAGP